jgi:flagellar biosynthesis anti-sigma factor FlgM
MKIDELNQNSAVALSGNGRADRSEAADAHAEGVAKQHAAADKVELSNYQPIVPVSDARPGANANKIAELKAQIDNGSYQVPALAVAEKMLAKLVLNKTPQSSV